jgi:predicted lipoprotein with Yx(FWY)xxD motif
LLDADTGHTLYQYSKDTPDVSTCTGTCIQNWPVFSVDKIVAPSFLDMSQFGTIVRADKANQTTFRHMPLYHYAQDQARGDLLGQGVGGFWSIVDPFATSTGQ